MSLSRLLAAIAEHSRRRAPAVACVALLVGGLAAWFAGGHLGFSTDTERLFAPTLPWRQREIAFNAAFPQFHNLLVAVIDADIPEEAEQTAADLAAALRDDPHFASVRRPDASPYFEANGLMLLPTKELGALLDSTIDAQPFLGQLVQDPSARGLFAALSLLGVGVMRGQANLAPFAPALRSFHATLAAAAAGQAQPLSWQLLLANPVIAETGRYRFVLLQPRLDYGALQPGGAATVALRSAASSLEFVRSGAAHVRVTGAVALADEEFATAAHGALAGTLASAALVVLWLTLAVRSWRLIVPIVLTLILGLVLTTGFAAVAVGTLNVISIAFAVLFVGIAVDFAIQLSVRYRAIRARLPDPAAALSETAHRVGPQIVVAAVAIAAGFYAFVPTAFTGVAELGLIAGTGMLVALVCTVVVLPALLTLLRPGAEHVEIGWRAGDVLERGLCRFAIPVLVGFAAVSVLGAVLLPRLPFDSDPLHTKDPATEAMRTLTDLMGTPLTNPYTGEAIAADLPAADALAERLRVEKLVAGALTLSSFVPTDQKAKLALLADAAGILGPTLAARSPAVQATPADLRLAAQTAANQLELAREKLAQDDPLMVIAADLRALAAAPDATLVAADQALTRFLPLQIDRLRRALDAKPVAASNVPPEIARDWLLPDGRARIQVLSRPEVRHPATLRHFADAIQTVVPEASGSAVGIVATAATIVSAFRAAALGALVAVAALLLAVLQRLRDTALVLAPLLLSGLMTVVAATAIGLSLNFANVIALPLLLGVGVSFNIYFVMNWRAGQDRFLGTATARAIVFSALTTATAFGSLALSRHPGTASMGVLLLLSLACTLAASLLFEPTILRMVRRR